jgi:hypothetical protein
LFDWVLFDRVLFDRGLVRVLGRLMHVVHRALAGLILGAIAAFIIDRRFDRATLHALFGAVLAFFGFINGTALGFGNSSSVALGYLLLGAICLELTRHPKAAAGPIGADAFDEEVKPAE